ncbi:MAG: PQQ-binding-like beta-propeller repeat protein [Bdellovibrionales bacterium]|nr:PQQ-binding-like beta-propeller repeat protein [Bdellovibrionales bacterium]
MDKKVALGLVLFSLILAPLIYLANPHFLYIRDQYYEIIPHPPKAPATLFKKVDSSCESNTQFRVNAERVGYQKDAKPRAAVEIKKHIFPLNVGIHSASKSSPVADDSGIYVGSDTGWFWKMDFDGNKVWEFYIPGSGNGIHGSPAVDDKKVFIGAYNGFLYALDKMSGELLWANPVADFIGASPLVADGGVFISGETAHPDGLVARLDCNTGQTQWVSKWLGGHSHSSPAFHKETGSILVGANSGRLFSFDVKDGSTHWQKQFRGQIKGTPTILGKRMYFGSWDKNYHAVDIATGDVLWSTFLGGRTQTSLTLVPGHNIGITNTRRGDIAGLNLENGEFLWRLHHGDSNHQFSVLVTASKDDPRQWLAFSRCKSYQLCVLDAVTGKLLHNINLPGGFTSVPYAHGERVYISLIDNHGLVILE